MLAEGPGSELATDTTQAYPKSRNQGIESYWNSPRRCFYWSGGTPATKSPLEDFRDA